MMRNTLGITAGLSFAAVGIVVGLFGAWLGFASTPHDSTDLGLFFGTAGALVGCTCGILGALAGRWRARPARVRP
jgi:peptidoglycan/LPS O-acetylase OafA/YrhL